MSPIPEWAPAGAAGAQARNSTQSLAREGGDYPMWAPNKRKASFHVANQERGSWIAPVTLLCGGPPAARLGGCPEGASLSLSPHRDLWRIRFAAVGAPHTA